MTSAADIIAALDLQPHPEGGHFREMFRDPQAVAGKGDRAPSTAIYYLLEAGQRSHWHRVDAAEVWHWYAGAPLQLSQSADAVAVDRQVLGNDVVAGQRPQIVVPLNVWQSAEAIDGWALVGCTVAPGFSFDGFELAPPGWTPGDPLE